MATRSPSDNQSKPLIARGRLVKGALASRYELAVVFRETRREHWRGFFITLALTTVLTGLLTWFAFVVNNAQWHPVHAILIAIFLPCYVIAAAILGFHRQVVVDRRTDRVILQRRWFLVVYRRRAFDRRSGYLLFREVVHHRLDTTGETGRNTGCLTALMPFGNSITFSRIVGTLGVQKTKCHALCWRQHGQDDRVLMPFDPSSRPHDLVGTFEQLEPAVFMHEPRRRY